MGQFELLRRTANPCFGIQETHHILNGPNVVREACGHCGGHVNSTVLLGQRPMLPAEVVDHEMQGNRVGVIIDLP